MINSGKRDILGIKVDAVDYEAAIDKIFTCVLQQKPCTATALAVHGLVTGSTDPVHRFRLNAFDLAVPDGQPVRWALNILHGTKLRDRVYGPKLTLKLCQEAARRGVAVSFFGSREVVLQKLCSRLTEMCPGLKIVGAKASRFRRISREETDDLARHISHSGAQILFVGLGCPRQEVFAYEMSTRLNIPIIAVGAAFDYHSGLLKEPPEILQRAGLQWLYRLVQEPRRLWRRYLVTNTQFVILTLLQFCRIWDPQRTAPKAPSSEVLYG